MRLELSKTNVDSSVNRNSRKFENIYGILTAVIPLVGFIIFSVLPIIISSINSFREYGGIGSPYELVNTVFVGFKKFGEVLQDPIFWHAVGNTFLNCLLTPACITVGLIIALLVSNSKLFGRNFFKALFFIPYVCSIVASCLIWVCILEDGGPLNVIFQNLGWAWFDLNNPTFVMPFMIFLGVWSGVGFSVIMYCAALTNTDSGILEAAEIDGANKWHRFWHITFPSIMPVTFFLLITGIIGNLQDFTRFSLVGDFYKANNGYVTIAYYLYHYMDSDTLDLGLACAASWILTIIVLVVTITQFVVNRKQGDTTK